LRGPSRSHRPNTKSVRTVDIEPHLHLVVKALVTYPQGKGPFALSAAAEDRAGLLGKDIRTVGVVREALHVEHDSLQRAIVFHDLRDIGLTHMPVRGDSPILITWAGGHTDFKTAGDLLPPLPPDIAPIPLRVLIFGGIFPFSLGKLATPTGIEPVLPT
jgi:hypothetical protein